MEIQLRLYVLEYKLHGNIWRIKTIATSVGEAKKNASKAVFMPASSFKNRPNLGGKLFHGTWGAERVYG